MISKCLLKLVIFVLSLGLVSCACLNGLQYEFENKCYVFYKVKGNLSENMELCSKLNGMMVSISSAEENEFVKSLVPDDYAWIGLKRPLAGLRFFSWMDNSSMNYTNWGPSQPIVLPTPEWGAVIRNNGDWYDSYATNMFWQMCQVYNSKHSKKVETMTSLLRQVLARVEAHEKVTKDLSHVLKEAIGKMGDLASVV